MLPTVRRSLDNPFAMLREFDRVLGRAIEDAPTFAGDTFAVDVYEQDDTLVVEAELPGCSRDQVSVNVEQGVLTIEANRSEKSETTDGDKASKCQSVATCANVRSRSPAGSRCPARTTRPTWTRRWPTAC